MWWTLKVGVLLVKGDLSVGSFVADREIFLTWGWMESVVGQVVFVWCVTRVISWGAC